MALELRIMSGSDITMAPQYGNKHGTLSIEPVSTRMVHEGVWEDFKEELAKVWMSYKDYDGSPLKCRFHWAKENPRSVQVDGSKVDTLKYLQHVYMDQMNEFFDVLDGLTEGVTAKDLYNLFSNKYLDDVFKPQWERFGISVMSSQAANGSIKEENNDLIIPKNQESSLCCYLL